MVCSIDLKDAIFALHVVCPDQIITARVRKTMAGTESISSLLRGERAEMQVSRGRIKGGPDLIVSGQRK